MIIKSLCKKIAEKKHQGMGLIEIMLYTGIVAILLVGVLQLYNTIQKRSKVSSTKNMLSAIKAGIDNFRVDVGRYPIKLDELVTAPSDAQERRRWQKGYVPDKYITEGSILDAWGNAFEYKLAPNKASFELSSWGPDGEGAETGNVFAE